MVPSVRPTKARHAMPSSVRPQPGPSAKGGAAALVGDVGHPLQQQVHVGLWVALLAREPRAVHAGRAVQRSHRQPGVVRHRIQAGQPPGAGRLEQSVADERVGVLHDVLELDPPGLADLGLAEHLYAIAAHRGQLAQLALVAGRKNKRHRRQRARFAALGGVRSAAATAAARPASRAPRGTPSCLASIAIAGHWRLVGRGL